MFCIHSISAGWILGQISDGNKIHHFDYNYITNFLDAAFVQLSDKLWELGRLGDIKEKWDKHTENYSISKVKYIQKMGFFDYR